MNRFFKIALLVLPLLYLMQERIKGLGYLFVYPKEQILIRQLLGDGCGYQHFCSFDIWWFSGGNIRNSEYNCPMMAADCMAKFKIDKKIALPALKEALPKKTPVYDTGDGVLFYQRALESAIAQIEAGEYAPFKYLMEIKNDKKTTDRSLANPQ